MKKQVCKVCGNIYANVADHVNKVHKISSKEYYDKYIWNGKYPKCNWCGKEMNKFMGMPYGYNSKSSLGCCSSLCGLRYKRKHKSDPKLYPYKCELCGKRFSLLGGLSRHITNKHQNEISIKEYYDTYIKTNNNDGVCKWCGKPTKLSGLAGYNNFCYNTNCNVLWYNENQNRASVAGKTIQKLYKSEPWRILQSTEYWIRKGYTKKEAQKKVTERQTTFSKKICIEKYGKTEGLARWQLRQKRWIDSFPKQNYSMISQELFWKIYDRLPDNMKDGIHFATIDNGVKTEGKRNLEYTHKTKNSYVKLDFYSSKLNKCIEFDGDYWHDEHKDKERDYNIKYKNPSIDILHIKENEYVDYPETIVNECLEFLVGE